MDSLIVSPLRSSLVLKWKEDVSFNNFRVDNVLLKDSKGNQWNNISGEQVNLFNESENIEGIQIDMESVFYDNPQELYLDSLVLAVDDKDQVPVKINVMEKIIEKPHDEYIDFLDVKLEDDDIVLSFGFEYDPELDKINEFNRIKGVSLSIGYPNNDHIGPFKEFNQKMDTTYEDGKGKSVIRFPQKDLRETMTLMVKHQLEEAKEYDLNIKIK